MLVVDIILLIILIGFFIWGWQSGLLKTVGSFIGIILGIFLAGQYFEKLAAWLLPLMDGRDNLAKIVGYLAIFALVNIVVAIIIWTVGGVLKIIPFFSVANRLAGAVLSLVGGIFALGFLIIMLDKFPFAEIILPWLQASQVAPFLAQIANILMPLVPAALEQIKGVLPI